MLVLNRNFNETVVVEVKPGNYPVGCRMEITVVDVRNGKARLGFTAPDTVRIDRYEVWKRKQEQQNRESQNDSR